MVLGYIILQSKFCVSFLDLWSFLGVRCLVIPWFEGICFCLEPSLRCVEDLEEKSIEHDFLAFYSCHQSVAK